jgi:predicted Zn finger-like uncharacterized protein
MIIQCEQCRTKFKLDDNKVTKRGAKVRCAKCRHVFTVRKPGAAAPEERSLPAVEAASGAAIAAAAPTFDLGEVSFADVDVEQAPAATTPPPLPAGGLDFGTVLPQGREIEPSPAINFDFGEVSASPLAQQNISFDFTTKPTAIAAAPGGDIDFGGFDFGDVSVARPDDSFSLDGADFGGMAATRQPAANDSDDLGFSFGDVEPQSVTAPSDGLDFSGMDFGAAEPSGAAPAADSFSLGDFDFGTEAASVAMPANATQGSGGLFDFGTVETPSAPVAAPEQTASMDFTFEADVAGEASPLSIASRRIQSPITSTLVIVACLLLVGALGYMGYLFLGSGAKPAPFFGTQAQVEDGKITVQQVQASYLNKAAAGDLLIITGEALNSFSKPRAALQVKATLFSNTNEPVVTQLAYAGNQLTREQLKSMPWEKIEAAMANQFGDSLANLEVAPGKTIPFTLVIINPPATALDYSVEAVGSTVAASK